MNKKLIYSLSLLLMLMNACKVNSTDKTNRTTDENTSIVQADSLVDKIIQLATYKAETMLSVIGDKKLLPRSTSPKGRVRMVPSKDWTSGFFPGELWFIYSMNKDVSWLTIAEQFTSLLENQQDNGGTHDMGFKMFCSYGNGYRFTKNAEYKAILINSAYTLTSRYNPNVGCIKSWDWGADRWDFPVIIDNMMNLELLFWAFTETGDSMFYNIAVSHADKTMENHFRDDYSSYHVVDYDPASGQVLNKLTHQGYSASSVWARGQAWGLYGYTMCFRETGLLKYLEMAEHIADFILNHPNLAKDKIPYWDFNDPSIPDAPRDASAAAVICSALYGLSAYSEKGAEYQAAADTIFSNLASEKYTDYHSDHPFILKHSTGNKPANDEIDVPIIYADYYFIEAALRKLNLN